MLSRSKFRQTAILFLKNKTSLMKRMSRKSLLFTFYVIVACIYNFVDFEMMCLGLVICCGKQEST